MHVGRGDGLPDASHPFYTRLNQLLRVSTISPKPPDHSTISRTRGLIDLETHRALFTWVLQCLSTAGMVKGKTIGIDATTLLVARQESTELTACSWAKRWLLEVRI